MITQEQLPIVAMPSMNETHVEEIEIINRLDTAARNDDAEEVSKILNELMEHTAMHFFDEEDMMEDALFPAYKMHKNEHDNYLREFSALVKYFEIHKDTKVIVNYIEDTLTPWLTQHITTMDTMTALFLQQGLKLSSSCSATKGCSTGSC